MSILKNQIKLHPFTAPSADNITYAGAGIDNTDTAANSDTGTKEGGEQLKIPSYDVFFLFTQTVNCHRHIWFLTVSSGLDVLKNHLSFILDAECLDEAETKTSAEALLGAINASQILKKACDDDSFQGFDDGEFFSAIHMVSNDIAEKAYILALKIAEEYPVLKPFLEYFNESEADE